MAEITDCPGGSNEIVLSRDFPRLNEISGTDSRIQHSLTHLEDPIEIFVLHRDLSVSLTRARGLARALASDRRFRMAYAIALAGTGEDGREACRQAAIVAEIVPIRLDAMDGPFYQAGLALVYLRTNRIDEARQIVARVRRIPSIYYESMFNLSPAWDALRPL